MKKYVALVLAMALLCSASLAVALTSIPKPGPKLDDSQSRALNKLRNTLTAVCTGKKAISALVGPVKAWNTSILASGELKGYIPSLLVWIKANEEEMQRKGIDLHLLRMTLNNGQVAPVELPVRWILIETDPPAP